MKRLLALVALLFLVGDAAFAAAPLKPPKSGPITVAFVITDGANVMDLAGAWEVFQDAMTPNNHHPFRLITVSDSKNPIEMTGGMTIVPDYTFADAPKAAIISIGAQKGAPGLFEYLKARHTDGALILSVCTGAFKVAGAGLLDGKNATTHHDYFDSFRKQFPKVTLKPGNRYIQADERIFTAGGLTSGIDLALHIVELTYGRPTAQYTANYMEYTGTGWKTPEGASPLAD